MPQQITNTYNSNINVQQTFLKDLLNEIQINTWKYTILDEKRKVTE